MSRKVADFWRKMLPNLASNAAVVINVLDRRTRWPYEACALYAAGKFGVKGFSESPVEPLGIKVTIVQPGGFRTDFAGFSTPLRDGRPEYD